MTTNGRATQVARTTDALKIFISYSSHDMAAADSIVDDLERSGFAVTIDRRDLPYGEEWQKELAGFIAASDTVVWLVSPDSVKSKWVNWELGEVGRLSKRLVPVRIRDVSVADLPEALGRVHLLPADGIYDRARHHADLVKTLNTDRAWLKRATSLGEDAREWVVAGRDSAQLLRGKALADAETWSIRTPRNVPSPPSEVLELILASRRGQRLRQRRVVILSLAAAIVAIVLAGTALIFQKRAEEQAAIAMANDSTALAEISNRAAEENRPIDALMLALAAWPGVRHPERPPLRRVADALKKALPLVHERGVRLESVAYASFTPDSTRLLTVSPAGEARLINLETQSLELSFNSEESPVSMAISPDRSVVALHDDLWSLKSGTLIGSLVRPDDYSLGEPVFSRDGRFLAAPCAASAACVWDGKTGMLLRTLKGHSGNVHSASFSPDGKRIVTTSDDKTTRVWEVDSGKELAKLGVNGSRETTLALFSPDGKRLVAIAWTDILLWNTSDWTLIGRGAHDDDIRAVQFSPDSSLLATGSQDRTAKVWVVEDTKLSEAYSIRHGGEVTSIDFSADRSVILTGSQDHTVRMTAIQTGASITTLAGHASGIKKLAFSPNGARMITIDDESTSQLWTYKAGKPRQLDKLRGNYRVLAITSNGARSVVEDNGIFKVVDGNGNGIAQLQNTAAYDAMLSNAILSIGGKYVLLTESDTAQLWNGESGEAIGPLMDVSAAAFSPDDRTLATASEGRITLRQVDSAKIIAEFVAGHPVQRIFFSHDGSHIGAAVSDQSIRVWNVATATMTKIEIALETADPPPPDTIVFDPYGSGQVMFASFSSDDTLILAASRAGNIGVVDWKKGKVIRRFATDHYGDFSAALSRDATRLFTVGSDRAARAWDTATGAQIAMLRETGVGAHAPGLTPDGSNLFIPTFDGLNIWDVSSIETGDAFQVACQRLTNNTSLEEIRERYGLGELAPICGDNAPLKVEWADLK